MHTCMCIKAVDQFYYFEKKSYKIQQEIAFQPLNYFTNTAMLVPSFPIIFCFNLVFHYLPVFVEAKEKVVNPWAF